MDKSKLVVVLTMVLGAAAARAEAQVVEVSLGVGGAQLTAGYETWSVNLRSSALDGRANVTLSDRFSIEPYVTYGRRSIPVSAYGSNVIGGDTQRTEGLYGVVVHQRLRSTTRSGFHAYLSYGLSGAYFNETIPQHQFVNGRAVYYTQPARTRSDNGPMLLPSVGFGVRKSLGNHLAVRADADLLAFLVIPAGVRASVGLVVPIGGKR
jgi:hypothetical protein